MSKDEGHPTTHHKKSDLTALNYVICLLAVLESINLSVAIATMGEIKETTDHDGYDYHFHHMHIMCISSLAYCR